MIYDALYDLIQTMDDITDYVDTRVFYLYLPSSVSALPAISLRQIGADYDDALASPPSKTTFRLTCFSTDLNELHNLSEAVRSGLQGFHGVLGTSKVLMQLSDVQDDAIQPDDGSDSWVLLRAMDFVIY